MKVWRPLSVRFESLLLDVTDLANKLESVVASNRVIAEGVIVLKREADELAEHVATRLTRLESIVVDFGHRDAALGAEREQWRIRLDGFERDLEELRRWKAAANPVVAEPQTNEQGT